MSMYTTLHPSPVGALLLRADDRGRLTELFTRHDGAATTDWPFPEIGAQIDAYFAGEREDFDLELAPSGTEFQLRVWEQLVKIPYGETISYSELANRLGDPKLVRAVGLANGRNPISIIIPCHRVIGARTCRAAAPAGARARSESRRRAWRRRSGGAGRRRSWP
jgi:methylated-DNA-[protein]-cysteine S-methyltransferase